MIVVEYLDLTTPKYVVDATLKNIKSYEHHVHIRLPYNLKTK